VNPDHAKTPANRRDAMATTQSSDITEDFSQLPGGAWPA